MLAPAGANGVAGQSGLGRRSPQALRGWQRGESKMSLLVANLSGIAKNRCPEYNAARSSEAKRWRKGYLGRN
jgi:hypothetical protein